MAKVKKAKKRAPAPVAKAFDGTPEDFGITVVPGPAKRRASDLATRHAAVEAALAAQYRGSGQDPVVVEVTPDAFVYTRDGKTWRQEYTFDGKKANFEDFPEEVR